MKEFIRKIFQSNSGVSSKRICGVLGWIVCIGCSIYCTINNTQAPSILTDMMYCCLGLLGIDSITGIWKYNTKSNKDEINTSENS